MLAGSASVLGFSKWTSYDTCVDLWTASFRTTHACQKLKNVENSVDSLKVSNTLYWIKSTVLLLGIYQCILKNSSSNH